MNGERPVAPPPDVPFLEFREVCGSGGMGTVWHAWHRILQRDVAVKVLDDAFASNPADLERFTTEARVLAYLDHPNIVKGYGDETVGGRHFYIMDYVGGYTFAAFRARKVRIPEVDVMLLIESVAAALGYAWKTFRTVHCDIKPENLMVDLDGTVKITDMGLASETIWEEKKRVAALTKTDVLEGTPAYMSPEQIYGDTELDCRTDIYSLGATAYDLATGQQLFPERTPRETVIAHTDPEQAAPDPRRFAPGLSEPFVRLLARMLVKDRDKRLPNWNVVTMSCEDAERGIALPPPTAPSSVRLDPAFSPAR